MSVELPENVHVIFDGLSYLVGTRPEIYPGNFPEFRGNWPITLYRDGSLVVPTGIIKALGGKPKKIQYFVALEYDPTIDPIENREMLGIYFHVPRPKQLDKIGFFGYFEQDEGRWRFLDRHYLFIHPRFNLEDGYSLDSEGRLTLNGLERFLLPEGVPIDFFPERNDYGPPNAVLRGSGNKVDLFLKEYFVPSSIRDQWVYRRLAEFGKVQSNL